jgi:argininosuccinate lyase
MRGYCIIGTAGAARPPRKNNQTEKNETMSRLWGGRFEKQTDRLVEALGESVSFDARLAPWDIRASMAHARMLGACAILPGGEVKKILRGLREIERDIEAGTMTWDTALEDVHTNIEAALIRKIGAAGKRLHTARSRNDQIATDMRLWCRDQIDAILADLRALQEALVGLAETHRDVILPGFTHLQAAQPVLFAHHLLAYFEMFDRDKERFSQMRPRVNVMPLGSAALAGTPWPIDRNMTAKELGFDAVSRNSMDAVSDRDYLIEFCAGTALVMMHLSRFCEELILWMSPGFGFICIGDAFTTGSSIMPQKKNPDVAELIRGKTGRVYGGLHALLTLMKGLPLTYNRDLQEDKETVFDTADTVQLCLRVFTRMLPAIEINREAMAAAVREGFMEATDLADYLVEKGLPFREAHAIVGRIVLYGLKKERKLPELTLEEFQEFSELFEKDICKVLQPETIIRRRDNAGGTAPRRVAAALKKARRSLGML